MQSTPKIETAEIKAFKIIYDSCLIA